LGLAVLSFRRASWSNRGHCLSLFAVFPAIQIPVVLIMAALPRREVPSQQPDAERIDLADVLQGIIAGVAIIVAAVLISALTVGAYGDVEALRISRRWSVRSLPDHGVPAISRI